jgi:hypothetical protein
VVVRAIKLQALVKKPSPYIETINIALNAPDFIERWRFIARAGCYDSCDL